MAAPSEVNWEGCRLVKGSLSQVDTACLTKSGGLMAFVNHEGVAKTVSMGHNELEQARPDIVDTVNGCMAISSFALGQDVEISTCNACGECDGITQKLLINLAKATLDADAVKVG